MTGPGHLHKIFAQLWASATLLLLLLLLPLLLLLLLLWVCPRFEDSRFRVHKLGNNRHFPSTDLMNQQPSQPDSGFWFSVFGFLVLDQDLGSFFRTTCRISKRLVPCHVQPCLVFGHF